MPPSVSIRQGWGRNRCPDVQTFRTTDGHEGGQEKRLVSKRRRWFGKNPDNYSSNFANKNLNIKLPDDLTNVNF